MENGMTYFFNISNVQNGGNAYVFYSRFHRQGIRTVEGGDVVFISSPTGSGKTTFVLKIFLPYLCNRREKILYLVNRTVLKRQLEEAVNDLPFELRECIDIELYQTIEAEYMKLRYQNGLLQNNDTSSMQAKYGKYQCVICDEAHYFMMDSNYNTNTFLSYRFVRDVFGKKLRVYMSATISNIEEVICQEMNNRKYIQSLWYGCHGESISGIDVVKSGKIFRYSLPRNYNHINVNVIRSREEIKNIIATGNEKWLIFVDSKEFGKLLKKIF